MKDLVVRFVLFVSAIIGMCALACHLSPTNAQQPTRVPPLNITPHGISVYIAGTYYLITPHDLTRLCTHPGTKEDPLKHGDASVVRNREWIVTFYQKTSGDELSVSINGKPALNHETERLIDFLNHSVSVQHLLTEWREESTLTGRRDDGDDNFPVIRNAPPDEFAPGGKYYKPQATVPQYKVEFYDPTKIKPREYGNFKTYQIQCDKED